MKNNRSIGKAGEDLATQWLVNNGFEILERNYSFDRAEADIIAIENEELIFVEVKTLSGKHEDRYPESAVNPLKQKQYFKIADAYIFEKKMATIPVRFDVIAIRFMETSNPEIIHFRDAYRFNSTSFEGE